MRTRQQDGYIFKARGVWYVRYFETRVVDGQVKRVRIAKQLAPAKDENGTIVTKIKARDLAKPILAKVNSTNGAPKYAPETALSLSEFATRVYLPYVEQHKRPSTVKGYKDIWNNHLKPRATGLWLREMRCCDVQLLLDDIARPGTLTHNSLRHIKSALSGMFSVARRLGYFDGENPAKDTMLLEGKPSEQTYAYTIEEIETILSLLPEPAATIFAVAAFAGLRRGEIRGLRWEDYHDGALYVARSVWRGHVGRPKTQTSADGVPVITPLAVRLHFHRVRCGNPVTGPMFANLAGLPADLGNVLNRDILPALHFCEKCGKSEGKHGETDHNFKQDENRPKLWRGWHAARRGLATVLHDLGVDDLTIQKILRHSNVAVTRACYIKTLDRQRFDAMKQLEIKIGLTGNKVATEPADTKPAVIQ